MTAKLEEMDKDDKMDEAKDEVDEAKKMKDDVDEAMSNPVMRKGLKGDNRAEKETEKMRLKKEMMSKKYE